MSTSALSYLVLAMVDYVKGRSITDMETYLADLGYQVGLRMHELIAQRTGKYRRLNTVIEVLQYLNNTVWKTLYGRPADGLEESTVKPNQYMLCDHQPVINKYVALPREYADFNPSAFNAGIIKAVMYSAGFTSTVMACYREGQTVLVIIIEP